MRGVSQETLDIVEGMSIEELIEMIEDFGYSAEALSNEELNQLAISVLDGHSDEGDIEELDFSDSGAKGLARYMAEHDDD
jgi:hypothetical protein